MARPSVSPLTLLRDAGAVLAAPCPAWVSGTTWARLGATHAALRADLEALVAEHDSQRATAAHLDVPGATLSRLLTAPSATELRWQARGRALAAEDRDAGRVLARDASLAPRLARRVRGELDAAGLAGADEGDAVEALCVGYEAEYVVV